MKSKICPSMMCADIFDLENVIKTFENHGIDYLHIDVMDGAFVPNFTLGTDYCDRLHKRTDIPLDIHLMIENPESKLAFFPIRAGDYVSVHVESTRHLQRVLASIRALGAKPMVALNPATPIVSIENVLDDIDAVLLMTVNPGFSGQKLVESTLNKIKLLREYLDANGYGNVEIEVDGNVSFENAQRMKDMGANMFVVGSSSVFCKNLTLDEGIEKLKGRINCGLFPV